ncbi:MAG: hypothetical protein ACOC5F_03990 [Candidatus Aminicenantaceae bacterium]
MILIDSKAKESKEANETGGIQFQLDILLRVFAQRRNKVNGYDAPLFPEGKIGK